MKYNNRKPCLSDALHNAVKFKSTLYYKQRQFVSETLYKLYKYVLKKALIAA